MNPKTFALKSLAFAIVWIASIISATAQYTFSTLAGTDGVSGSADGTGSAASFSKPRGVAVDNAGNVYVVDTDSNIIRKIVISNGVVTTLAGTVGVSGTNDGSGTNAQFYFQGGPNTPSGAGIAADGMGNLYVADTGNSTIRQIVISNGMVSTLAGTPGIATLSSASVIQATPASEATFHFPWGVACDGAGNVYVADTWDEAIRKIDISTKMVTTLAGGLANSKSEGPLADGTGAAVRFNAPQNVAVNYAGNLLYVADIGNSAIRMIEPSNGVWWVTTPAWGAGQFTNPPAVAVDLAGNVYVADGRSSVIRKIVVSTGVITNLMPPVTVNDAQLNTPYGIAVDNSGNLYIADTGHNTIKVGMLPPPSCDSPCYVLKAGDTMTGTLNLPTNGLAVGGYQLVATNGNVGIGTPNPQYALDVNGGVNATGALNADGITTFDASTPTLNFYSPQRHSFTMKSEGHWPQAMLSIIDTDYGSPGTYLASFLPSGDVGIGTTSPDEKLAVSGGVDVMAAAANPTGNAGLGLSFESYGGRIQSFQSRPLILNPIGNFVGIGTTNPGAELSVSGGVDVTNGGIKVMNTSAPSPRIPATEAVLASGISGFYDGFRSVSGDSAVTMDTFSTYGEVSTYNYFTRKGLPLILNWNGGNVGIATGTLLPAAALEVNGNIACDGNYYTRNSDGTYSLLGGGDDGLLGLLGLLSDEQFKEKIATIPNAIATIEKLRGVEFNWNDKGLKYLTRNTTNTWRSASGQPEDDKALWEQKLRVANSVLSKQQIGFVAQEVEQVFPDWVTTDEQGIKRINMQHLDAVLVDAIKEQQTQIETQQKEITELKAAQLQAAADWEARFKALENSIRLNNGR